MIEAWLFLRADKWQAHAIHRCCAGYQTHAHGLSWSFWGMAPTTAEKVRMRYFHSSSQCTTLRQSFRRIHPWPQTKNGTFCPPVETGGKQETPQQLPGQKRRRTGQGGIRIKCGWTRAFRKNSSENLALGYFVHPHPWGSNVILKLLHTRICCFLATGNQRFIQPPFSRHGRATSMSGLCRARSLTGGSWQVWCPAPLKTRGLKHLTLTNSHGAPGMGQRMACWFFCPTTVKIFIYQHQQIPANAKWIRSCLDSPCARRPRFGLTRVQPQTRAFNFFWRHHRGPSIRNRWKTYTVTMFLN